MKLGIKISVLMVLVLMLTGCCQRPDIYYPPSPGNKYSTMGFIMGGGLVGHIIRESRTGKVKSSYAVSKQRKDRERHFNRYHNELNIKR